MKNNKSAFISMLILSGCLFSAAAVSAEDMVPVEDMVLIPEGSFTPFFPEKR